MIKNTSSQGFTIVELLIVIVVIAILASISTATFAGVRDGATNTVVVSDARKMKGLIDVYVATSGYDALTALLPTTDVYCLGEGYTDLDPGAGQACEVYSDGQGYTSYMRHTAPLDTALKTMGSYATSKSAVVGYGNGWSEKISSPFIKKMESTTTVDGQAGAIMLGYSMVGVNKDCILRPVLRFGSSSGGIINYVTNSGLNYSGGAPNATYCNILVQR